jgi:translation elongation factor EF-Tu-like GTPase
VKACETQFYGHGPDVEAEITLFAPEAGGRSTPAFSGYRPGHKVRDDYITTGVHQYIDRGELAPGETALATITFITPEVYPHCLWVGREIDIQEGSRVLGRARITKIYNAILAKVG